MGTRYWMRAMSRPSGDAEMLPVLDIRKYLSHDRNDVPSIVGYVIERCNVMAITFLKGLRVCLGGSLHKNGVGSTWSSQRQEEVYDPNIFAETFLAETRSCSMASARVAASTRPRGNVTASAPAGRPK